MLLSCSCDFIPPSMACMCHTEKLFKFEQSLWNLWPLPPSTPCTMYTIQILMWYVLSVSWNDFLMVLYCLKQLCSNTFCTMTEEKEIDIFSLPPHLQPDSQRPGAWLGAAYVLYNSLEREERLEKQMLAEQKEKQEKGVRRTSRSRSPPSTSQGDSSSSKWMFVLTSGTVLVEGFCKFTTWNQWLNAFFYWWWNSSMISWKRIQSILPASCLWCYVSSPAPLCV